MVSLALGALYLDDSPPSDLVTLGFSGSLELRNWNSMLEFECLIWSFDVVQSLLLVGTVSYLVTLVC